jgi:MFS family permease
MTLGSGDNRDWLRPLFATMLVQVTSAFLSRLVPTIAPVLHDERGMSEALVGYLAAFATLGSIAFLLAGGPMMRRYGPIRSLQLGMIASGLGIVLIAAPSSAALFIGMVFVGLGYGPSAPAGTEVLQRYAPARHRNLIFSIKQAGVPLGGVLAGLILPALVGAFDWRFTLVFAALIVAASVLAVQPLREAIDHERDTTQTISLSAFLSWSNIMAPLRTVFATPAIARIGLTGATLAISQGAWFAFLVTLLVADVGLSLAEAGFLFAVMQATGIPGRIALGYVADRAGSGRVTLIAVGVLSSLTSLGLALIGPGASFSLLIVFFAISGITVSSWNGVQLAEIARLAPREALRDTSSGGTVLIFLGYVVGPAGFALLQQMTGNATAGLVSIAVIALAGSAVLAKSR